MTIGQLNCRVQLEQPVPVSGTAADVSALQWMPVARVWAKFRATGGLEVALAEQMESRVWWQVTVWRRKDILPTWRITYRGRILNITSVVNVDEANEETLLTAWEGKGIN
jgi:SPP1 family predicted phage head-tail adaptor